jgi:hypothetical protein
VAVGQWEMSKMDWFHIVAFFDRWST